MTDEFIQPLLGWYDENKRILPWRDQHNACSHRTTQEEAV